MLTEVNQTLKTYLEKVVTKVAPEDAQILIDKQDERLLEVGTLHHVSTSNLWNELIVTGWDEERLYKAVTESNSLEDFRSRVSEIAPSNLARATMEYRLNSHTSRMLKHINDIRRDFGRHPMTYKPMTEEDVGKKKPPAHRRGS